MLQELAVRTISVFCAEAAERSAAWDASKQQDLPSCHLLDEGYTCVAQEGSFCATFRRPDDYGAPIARQQCLKRV